MDFLIVIIAVFAIVFFIQHMAVPPPSLKPKIKCPPHDWKRINDYQLRCDKCEYTFGKEP